MINAIEIIWIYPDGAPDAVSGDDEYNRVAFHQFLHTHNIAFKPRRTNTNKKLKIVERKNATAKAIISKLDDGHSKADTKTVLKWRSFLSNLVLRQQSTQLFRTLPWLQTLSSGSPLRNRQRRAPGCAQVTSSHPQATVTPTFQSSSAIPTTSFFTW